jgi:hypothetical protein
VPFTVAISISSVVVGVIVTEVAVLGTVRVYVVVALLKAGESDPTEGTIFVIEETLESARRVTLSVYVVELPLESVTTTGIENVC